MVFSSPIFLFAFLPIVFLLYYVLPSIRWKNALLVVASLLFYGFGEPFAMVLMAGVVLWSWAAALLLEKGGLWRTIAYPLGVIGNLSVLCVFKYTGFLISSLNTLTGWSLRVPSIALPIGISFFIFQAVSYLVDTARGTVSAQRSYARLLLYISFFPQLIAGPIVRYETIAVALTTRKVSVPMIASGFRRMIAGLAKKLFFADAFGVIADTVFADAERNAMPLAWLGAVCYALQIYFDFSGYSDMAIGMGRMFGFSFPANFRDPYSATSLTDFWRRWHISLTTWFREYLYIPLGGNRKGTVRTLCNRWLVFFCTGLWHGASWNFVLWGLLNGLVMSLERGWSGRRKKPHPVLSRLYTMLFVVCAFVLFRADSLAQAGQMYRAMFWGGNRTGSETALFFGYLTPLFLVTLVLALLCCTPIPRNWLRHLRQSHPRFATTSVQLATVLLLVLCILNVSTTTYHPFIYFRF